ncbi:ATP dependent DNA ligase [Nocardia rhamnosiphila]
MSKRISSRYTPGRRSPNWIKTPIRRRTDAIVAGRTTGTGASADTFGGQILAAHGPDGRLVHIGNVGTGFTMATRRALRVQLDESASTEPAFALMPARGRIGAVHFVEPRLVGSVEYANTAAALCVTRRGRACAPTSRRRTSKYPVSDGHRAPFLRPSRCYSGDRSGAHGLSDSGFRNVFSYLRIFDFVFSYCDTITA